MSTHSSDENNGEGWTWKDNSSVHNEPITQNNSKVDVEANVGNVNQEGSKPVEYDDSNANKFDKFFKITKRGSKLSVEILGGLTTFLSMAYILATNSSLLSGPMIKYGEEAQSWTWNSVFIATCFASAIATLIMAFVPNVPFALAPGMGLNAQVMLYMFGFIGPGYSFGGAMTIVFVSGVLFLIITFVGLREFLFEGIPPAVKSSISVGIGLFIAFIGFQNATIVINSDSTLVDFVPIRNMYLDSAIRPQAFQALVCFIGLFTIGVLTHFKVPGAVLIGVFFAAIIGIAFDVTPLENITEGWNLATRFAHFFSFKEEKGGTFGLCFPGFGNAFQGDHVLATIILIVSYGMVDLFDTLGTLHGLGVQSNLIQEDGKVVNFKRVLFADCIGAVVGAIFGTSSVTTFVESGTGISLGAKTGFTAVVVSIMFLLAIFISPIFSIIPSCATAPALIYVGVLMMETVTHIKFDNILDTIPIFLTIVCMPLTYSITNGVGIGILSYSVLHLVAFIVQGIIYLITKKSKNIPQWPISLPCGIIAILFVIVYFVPSKFTK